MMRNPFRSEPRDHAVEPLSNEDGAALERLHRTGFGRPWSQTEFEALLDQPAVFGYAGFEVGNRRAGPLGFVLARQASDEGEVLMIAVDPGGRRRGLGRLLMDAVLRELHSRRAAALYLEVDEMNEAALALYRRLGFFEVGRRGGYYPDGGAGPRNALVMRRDLR